MNRRRYGKFLTIAAVLVLTLAACDSSEADLSTTSSLLGGTNAGGSDNGVDGATTTTASDAGGDDGPTTTLRGSNVDSYEVIAREPATGGEILYIVIPQADYTDVDMENFVGDLIESETVTWGAEIFDDSNAVDAYRVDEADRTDEQVELLSQHHFVTVQNGDTLIFRGPFETSGTMVIGS